jgi:hypothetical protein
MARARTLVPALAAALSLCAVPALAGTAVNPRISPKHGKPKTVFRVGFTAPQAAGREGVIERSYSVEFTIRRGGCASGAAQDVPAAAAGERVRLKFAPERRWCRGRGRGTITQQEGPYCQPGQPCPEFPSTSKPIAHFSFRVK